MKLRVRVSRRTSRLEVPGEEPRLKELMDQIRETVLPSHGLSVQTEFSLSLNGAERLLDSGQTLSSCGVVSGDLICVILPQSAAATSSSDSSSSSTSSSSSSSTNTTCGTQQHQPSSSSAALMQSEEAAAMLDPELPPPSWEPMLCSEAGEGQAPLSLELLYHSARSTSPRDAIVVAGHLLMLETGFVPQCCELKASEMPAGWRSVGGAYKLHYSHPLCGDSLATVVGVCMGPVLVVNGILKSNQTAATVHKLCLDPSSYVTNQWPGESAAAAFSDLNKLSRIFKDHLAYPLIAAARHAMALPVAFGLAALPPELLLQILRLLDVRSVARLASVCRRLHAATADSSLWRRLFRRDFTDPDPSRPRDTDWKEVYKRSFKTRVSLRRPHFSSLPPYRTNPRDMFIPAPFYPPLPGIIGGEYDQRPNLPRPPYDPIRSLSDPIRRLLTDGRGGRQMGGRSADVRRGLI